MTCHRPLLLLLLLLPVHAQIVVLDRFEAKVPDDWRLTPSLTGEAALYQSPREYESAGFKLHDAVAIRKILAADQTLGALVDLQRERDAVHAVGLAGVRELGDRSGRVLVDL